MKLLKKKVLSSAMALAMVASFALPMMSAYADSTAAPKTKTEESSPKWMPGTELESSVRGSQLSKEIPDNTTLNIYKIAGTTFGGPFNHDGGLVDPTSDRPKTDADGYILLTNGNKATDRDGNPTKVESEVAEGQEIAREGVYSTEIGQDVVGLEGVKFSYFKVTEEQAKTLMNAKAKDAATVNNLVPGLTEKEAGTTGEGGKLTVTLPNTKKDGNVDYYYFIETERPATISNEMAVPFVITTPVTNVRDIKLTAETATKEFPAGTYDAGTVYLKEVNVYPKNIKGNLPDIEKDVEEVGNDNANYNVGDKIPWVISADIPSNINDYESYEINDKLDSRLTYVSGSIEVYIAPKTAKTIAEIKAANNKITEATVGSEKLLNLTEGNILKVAVNPNNAANAKETPAFAKLAELAGKAGENKMFVIFETEINETAEMGVEIPNKADLEFDNINDDKAENNPYKPETDENTVETGGKKFHKNEDGNVSVDLANAVFAVNDDKTQMVWTEGLIKANLKALQAGKFAKDDKGGAIFGENIETKTVEEFMAELNGKNIFAISDANGEFEIAGLQYTYYFDIENPDKTPLKGEALTADVLAAAGLEEGDIDKQTGKINQKIAEAGVAYNDKSEIDHKNVYLYKHAYNLKEVKAPEGFALREDTIEFVVDSTSYNNEAAIKFYENSKMTDEEILAAVNESNKKRNEANVNTPGWEELPEDITDVEEAKKYFSADPTEVLNKNLTIPQTGGIGTVLFAIAGTAVMGGAAFMIVKRRRSEEN